ncbi:MAG TPA: carbon storage regulator CsrA [Thiohalobacter sp.]|nr:carbon storage regulator CsrA [Thiohalobacter sp.]
MLVLTRRPGEILHIGDKIKVTVLDINGGQVRIGIDAPGDLTVLRDELLQNPRQAASPGRNHGLPPTHP